MALLLLFGRHGPIGAWLDSWFGFTFAFRWTGAALAAAVMGFPLVVRALQLSIEGGRAGAGTGGGHVSPGRSWCS